MKIILAPDSFKESMTAQEVCQAMEKGIKKVAPKAQIISLPMADGGEGTTDALVAATNGRYITREVTGPLGQTVKAKYGILGNDSTAVIEMAQASGIGYLTQAEKLRKIF